MINTPKGFGIPVGVKAVRDSDLKCHYNFKGLCRASAFPRLGRVQLQASTLEHRGAIVRAPRELQKPRKKYLSPQSIISLGRVVTGLAVASIR